MEKEFLVNQSKLSKEGYVIISSYFLDYCVEILGTGPGMLYIQLLNYCHKGKDIAWPTLATLGKKMQFTPKSITKFHQVLLKYGLIKKISKGKTPSGNFRRNIYQITPPHRVKNTLLKGNIFPQVEEKITPDIGKKLLTNNTNLNNINITTTNREKDAVVAVVNFKKLKEKGEERRKAPYNSKEHYTGQAPYSSKEKEHYTGQAPYSSKEKEHYTGQAPYSSKEKEHYTGQAIRERMVESDFEEEFIEKITKEYSLKKIEEKLDLLMEMRNIKSPTGWLRAALNNDYTTPHPHLNPPPSRGRKFVESECGNPKCRGLIHQTRLESAGRINPPPTKTKTNSKDNKILSTEEVRRRFKLLRHELMAMK